MNRFGSSTGPFPKRYSHSHHRVGSPAADVHTLDLQPSAPTAPSVRSFQALLLPLGPAATFPSGTFGFVLGRYYTFPYRLLGASIKVLCPLELQAQGVSDLQPGMSVHQLAFGLVGRSSRLAFPTIP